MALDFNTGLAKPQRTLITEGAIALLSGLLRPTGYLATVIPWGSVVRSYTDEVGVVQLHDALSARAPGIAIATGDGPSTTAGIGGFQAKKVIDLLVYFASTNKRDGYSGRMARDGASLASGTADPGLHVMMEHAAELLIGQRCGASSSIKQIVTDREEELYTGEQVTIWLQTYRVEVRTNLKEFRNATQLLADLRFRLATNPDEVRLPDAATDPGTLDTFNDDIGA
jgi:hypothetical protein